MARHDIEEGRMDFEVQHDGSVEVGFLIFRGDEQGFEEQSIQLSRESLEQMLAAASVVRPIR